MCIQMAQMHLEWKGSVLLGLDILYVHPTTSWGGEGGYGVMYLLFSCVLVHNTYCRSCIWAHFPYQNTSLDMDVLNISQPDQICENFCIPCVIWTLQWMDAAIKISLCVFCSFRWFCDPKALIKTLETSWLGFGQVEWVKDELKVLDGFNIRNNYRFIWSNLVILWVQSTFNEFGDQLTGLGTSWMG